MVNEKKAALLYILDVLKEYTDNTHCLTYSAILDKLKSVGIDLDRKTVANAIDVLTDKGYDIRKNGNHGVCLASRNFEDGELLFLIDAIYSSRSIPSKYANELIKKLTSDFSIYSKKRFNHLEKFDDSVRANNKELFLTIETLNEAIEQGKQVEFQYVAYNLNKEQVLRDNGKKFLINPYYMVNNLGKYYLICNYDKYDSIAIYKIEQIANIKISKTPVKPLNSLPGNENFSIKDYIKENIYMTTGNSVLTTIRLDDENRVNDVISWFGNQILITKKESGIYATMKVNETSLIYWAMQYGEYAEVVYPTETREKIQQFLINMMKKYEK